MHGPARHPPLRRRRHKPNKLTIQRSGGAIAARRLRFQGTCSASSSTGLRSDRPDLHRHHDLRLRLRPPAARRSRSWRMAGERGVTPERYAELKEQFGFDLPLWQQYLRLCRRASCTAISASRSSTKRPVLDEFMTLFPATLELSLCAIIFAIVARHSGRHLRGGQARLLVRPGADGHRARRLFHADLLVGPAADHPLFRLSRLDAGLGPHRPAVLLQAGHRLHADRQLLSGKWAPSARRCST